MDKETEALIKVVAHDSAKSAVHGTLVSLGIDPNNPIDSQHDFAMFRELMEDGELRKDLEFARSFRESMDTVKKATVRSAVGFVITVVLTGMWLGFKAYFPGG